MAALSQWYSAFAGARSSPAKVLVIGDSISEGIGATSSATRWPRVLLSSLRAAAGVTGGGIGTVPGYYQGEVLGSISWSDSHVSSTMGRDSQGPYGYRDGLADSGQSATYSVTGTSAHIWYGTYSGSGTFTYAVDGGSTTSVNTNAGAFGFQRTGPITLGASGAHTLTVSYLSGGVQFVSGVQVYDGDESSGIWYYDAARSGITTTQYVDNSTFGWTVSSAAWNTLAPDLAIIELGLNDAFNAISSSTMTTNLTTIVAGLRGLTKPPSIMVVASYTPAPSELSAATWATYVSAMATMCATDGNLAFVDLRQFMPTATTSGTGFYITDGVHPNDSGHAKIAQVLRDQLLLPEPGPLPKFSPGRIAPGGLWAPFTGGTTDRVVATGNITTTTVVACAATVPAVQVQAGSAATPAVIAGTAATPAATVQAGSVAAPSAVAGVVAIPTPNVSAGGSATATPAVVQGTAAIPAAAVQAGSAATPTVVAGSATVSAATVQAGSAATPAVVAGSVGLPAATVHAGSAATPAVVAGTVTLPAATLSTGSVVGPTTIAGVAMVPTPGVSAGGSATATPATVQGAAALAAVTVQAGSTATPAVVAGTAAIPAVTTQAGSAVTPPVVAGTTSVPAAQTQAGSVAAPAGITRAVTIPAPTVTTTGSGTATPATIQLVMVIPASSIVAGSTISLATIARSVSIPTPTIHLGAATAPAVVGGAATIPTAAVTVGSTVSLATITAAVAFPTLIRPAPDTLDYPLRAGTPTDHTVRLHAGGLVDNTVRYRAGTPT